MAISPNTNFTAGAIYTATQANAFPRGIMAIGTLTSNTSFTTTEVVIVTASSFTAVANRYYRITFYVPGVIGQANEVNCGIRLTNATGTKYSGQSMLTNVGTSPEGMSVVAVTTLAAGATVLVGTAISYAGASTFQASATQPSFICVEDIGPA